MVKFVPRQRKHRVLAREKALENARYEIQDTNQDELPANNREKAATEKAQDGFSDLSQRKPPEKNQKNAAIREDLRHDGAKVSGKKAKRLEKYLDNKRRKDENRALLAKLAASKVDTSLFVSSKSLGQGRETKRQALSRALREKRAGIEEDDADTVLFERRREPDVSDIGLGTAPGGESSEEGHASDNEADSQPKTVETLLASEESSKPITSAPKPVGSGLKRPLAVDENGRPIISKRQKRGGVKTKIRPTQPVLEPPSMYEEWNGISSDAASNGPSDDEDESDGSSTDDALEHADNEGSGSEEGSSVESEDTTSDETTDDESVEEEEGKRARPSAFKAWAQQMRNEALGFQPSSLTSNNLAIPRPQNFVPRAPEQDPLPKELQPTSGTERKVFAVAVSRSPEIQEARLKLPIVSEEQRLMEAIHNNDIVVICGSTGSGKTTQVPQFLFEAGYGHPDSPTSGIIGVTQPRRVAAVSMSKRVGEELGQHSNAVAYQIRFEGNVGPHTAIKFMTDGMLLREAADDISLRKYSAIIVDEAHERSVNTDVLVGMLSRVVKLRAELAQEDPTLRPMKLIIMSATLRIEDMTMNPKLFPTPPPVVEVEGRQHPVTIHFSQKTHHNYVEEAFRKISRGHKKLPPGGFLVFLTGQNEIVQLSRRLKAAFGGLKTADPPRVRISATDAPIEVEDVDFGDVHDVGVELSGDHDEGAEEEAEEEDEFQIEQDQEAAPLKLQILPLYSLLPTREQMRVFEEVPEGHRRIVLATNVAETSLTIPGIKFVFDCGRSKERRYDCESGVQSYEIGWISKASASQRCGRAGRTGPGHCYRLYSSAVYERDFVEFGDPEILRTPIEGVVLQLKAMNIDNAANFPFPSPPAKESLTRAESVLKCLTAVSPEGRISEIGRNMSVFPVSPRFARILLVGHLHDCLPYTIALVAGLTAKEVFLPENQAVPELAASREHSGSIRSNADIQAETRQADARRMYKEVHRNFCSLDDRSDAIKLLQVVGEFAHEPTEDWCRRHFVRYKVLREISQLRRQLTELLRVHMPRHVGISYQDKLPAPTSKQVSALKQMAAVGFVDQVAIRADLAPSPPELYRKPTRAIDVPYVPLQPLAEAATTAAVTGAASGSGPSNKGLVYVHPTSPLAHLSPLEMPEYVVYSHLQRATSGVGRQSKTRMHALTDVTGGQLASMARGTPLVSYGKPIKEIKSSSSSVATGARRECWLVPYLKAEGVAGQGWPLPVRKVTQRRVPGKGWVVDE